MKSKILICSLITLLICSFLFVKRAYAFDDEYLKGRAIQMADFKEDDLVVEPKLIYNLAPDKYNLPDLITPNAKVISLVSPKYSLGSISAVFEAPKYTVQDQNRQLNIFSFKRRVGDILTDGGLVIAKEDIISPSKNSLGPAVGEAAIKITRVSVAEVEEFSSVPYQVKKSDDPTLNKGVEKVTKAGINGKKRLLFQVRQENGIEVSKKQISEEILSKPQDQLVSVGTKPTITVRCKFNDTVSQAAAKYKVDANTLCKLMMKESNGNPNSVNPDGYYGLFQYELGFWADISAKAGYAGANWNDPTAQIYTTAYAFANGKANRW